MLKEIFLGQVHRLGFQMRKRVPNGKVAKLVSRLHPVVTDNELVRIGGDSDGGYLVPDDLDGIAACFSPGVDVTATFEEALLERGIPCFLADASVDAPPIAHPLLDFEKKFLGVVNDEITTTLDAWVTRKRPEGGDLLLQMDIEGAEWLVLLNASDETLNSFRIIVLELHQMQHCFDPAVLRLYDACLDRLGKAFHVVHVHVNNCGPVRNFGGIDLPQCIEITYLRKDRAEARGFASEFPHPLDRGNLNHVPDTVLPAAFRGTGS